MHIPEEIMEPIVDTLRVIDIMGMISINNKIDLTYKIIFIDNPLVCDCELQWYKNWMKNLRDKDDEMMQKKRTVCMMSQEHREYSLQNLPLEKLHCVIKNYGSGTMSSSTKLTSIAPKALSLWALAVLCTV